MVLVVGIVAIFLDIRHRHPPASVNKIVTLTKFGI